LDESLGLIGRAAREAAVSAQPGGFSGESSNKRKVFENTAFFSKVHTAGFCVTLPLFQFIDQ
jgi:hypothetical protein